VKKIHLILSMLGLLVLACSTTSLIPATPTFLVPASLPTETLQPPTASPTETLSFTSTPAPSTTPTPSTATSTSLPTSTNTEPALTTATPLTMAQTTSTPQIQPTPEGPAFESVTISGPQIIWGDSCQANSVTVIAQTASGFNVASVLLFTRLQSQTRDFTSLWNDPITMHNDGLGTFTYDLTARGITNSENFDRAWVQYQLVATNMQNQIVDRTQVYSNFLTIAHCP